MPIIDVKATGNNIKNIIKSKGFKITDVQARCGFNPPQAIFKWMRGESVPTIDNLIILADMFDVPNCINFVILSLGDYAVIQKGANPCHDGLVLHHFL